MSTAKGIQHHAFFKLGKAPAKADARNFKFAALLKKVPPRTPPQYDFDVLHPGIPTPMFANDVHGDCVIAARAHLTLRFEHIEQGSVLMISDNDVVKEYWKESGGADDGLNMLDSLKAWRQTGWLAAGFPYKINAFAQITPTGHDEVQAAIYLLTAAYVGLALPKSAQAQIQTGQPWAVASGPADAPPPKSAWSVAGRRPPALKGRTPPLTACAWRSARCCWYSVGSKRPPTEDEMRCMPAATLGDTDRGRSPLPLPAPVPAPAPAPVPAPAEEGRPDEAEAEADRPPPPPPALRTPARGGRAEGEPRSAAALAAAGDHDAAEPPPEP